MTPAPNTKRLTCATCLRPQRTCICRWITPTAHTVEVLVLQHPLEVGNAKGSGRLLHLSLPRSRLAVGEVFSEQALHALLHAPFDDRKVAGAQPGQTILHAIRHAILLYPDTFKDNVSDVSAPPSPSSALLREPAQLRLIVLDGTWRKSRKMLHCNPLLQKLPRLPLHDMPASHYLIRKAHGPDQRSTLEATCYALMQLEKDDLKYEPLLNAFDGFVAQQAGYNLTGGNEPI